MSELETKSGIAAKIDELLEPYGSLPWGVCDVGDRIALPQRYEKAIVIIVPFEHLITLDDYTEPLLKGEQTNCRAKAGEISSKLNALLDREGVRYAAPPSAAKSSDDFEKNMTEIFSVKEAARRAGLGWIGKSTLLVTEQYGPRLTVIVVLADVDIPSGAPVDQSKCGDCRQCEINCPYEAIKGRVWELGASREDQVDFRKCSTSRLEGFAFLGRKINCAKCIAACPNGTAAKEQI